MGRNKMASRTRLSLRLRCHGFKGRALKFHSRGREPGDEATPDAPKILLGSLSTPAILTLKPNIRITPN